MNLQRLILEKLNKESQYTIEIKIVLNVCAGSKSIIFFSFFLFDLKISRFDAILIYGIKSAGTHPGLSMYTIWFKASTFYLPQGRIFKVLL